MKKVILLLIDALMPEALENGITTGKTPALKFLMDHGSYQSECVTAFPTMTASVDATLMTGVYPDQHKIPGLIWYNPKEKRLIDYVNGTQTVLKLGLNKTVKDVLINLNDTHMSKNIKTVFEELADHEKTSGSINFIVHRGRSKHKLKPPLLLNLVSKFSLYNKEISGPEILSIGAMYKPKFPGRKIPWGINQSIFQHFGINDSYATQVTKYTIASGKQPDLMLIYFPDHDHFLHSHISQPLLSLEKVDQKISELLNVFGSWDKAIKHNTFIVIGDHGQTEIGKDEEHNIDLDKILHKFKIVNVGNKINEEDEIIIANNERMVYVYPLNKKKRMEVLETLLLDSRIDFIAYKHGEEVVVQNIQGLELTYSRNGNYLDPYGVSWKITGDLDLLDIKVNDKKQIAYHDYPDALSRLYGAMYSQDAFVFAASAKPDYEFKSKTFPMHLGGGSHGSLHRIDSIVPLLVSGATKQPKQGTRIVDLKEYILHLLNVTSTTTG